MKHEAILKSLEGCRLPDWEKLPDFGMYMDQMITFVNRSFPGTEGRLDLTASMINNYVKAGIIDKPSGKKYSRDALAQLLMIVQLKLTTPIPCTVAHDCSVEVDHTNGSHENAAPSGRRIGNKRSLHSFPAISGTGHFRIQKSG